MGVWAEKNGTPSSARGVDRLVVVHRHEAAAHLVQRSSMNFSPAWIGTPSAAQMSACISITLSSLERPQPSG